MTATVLLLALLLLILLNIPVAFAIGITCLGYLWVNDINLAILGQRVTQGIYSYPFLALPMFVFAGVIMEYGGITEAGRLRHPVWRGLRDDINPEDVTV